MGHDVVEVVLSNKSIVIKVGLLEDLLDFIVGEILAEILGDLL